jgi:23S rRNA (uracil1939-C5)-methyltransferase
VGKIRPVSGRFSRGHHLIAAFGKPCRKLIDALAARGIERVVYISCDADTLARDCVRFREDGYEIGAVTPVDMFPRTGHVESVVCLTRKENV